MKDFRCHNCKRIREADAEPEECAYCKGRSFSPVASASPAALLPQSAEPLREVKRLVIAARRAYYSGDVRDPELDQALEAFAALVPWDDEDDAFAASPQVPVGEPSREEG